MAEAKPLLSLANKVAIITGKHDRVASLKSCYVFISLLILFEIETRSSKRKIQRSRCKVID